MRREAPLIQAGRDFSTGTNEAAPPTRVESCVELGERVSARTGRGTRSSPEAGRWFGQRGRERATRRRRRSRARSRPDASARVPVRHVPAADEQQACRLALVPQLLSKESSHVAPDRPSHWLGHQGVAPPRAGASSWGPTTGSWPNQSSGQRVLSDRFASGAVARLRVSRQEARLRSLSAQHRRRCEASCSIG